MATNVLRLEWMFHFDPSAKIDELFFFNFCSQYSMVCFYLNSTSNICQGGRMGDLWLNLLGKDKMQSAAKNQKHLTSAYWLHNPKTWSQKDPAISKTPLSTVSCSHGSLYSSLAAAIADKKGASLWTQIYNISLTLVPRVKSLLSTVPGI